MDDFRQVVLVGPRGSGKTSVGEELANQLKINLIDIEGILCRIYGVGDISLISDKAKLLSLRRVESYLLTDSLGLTPSVVATEAGVVFPNPNIFSNEQASYFSANNLNIKKRSSSIFIYLKPTWNLEDSVRILFGRLEHRANLENLSYEAFKEEFLVTHPFYKIFADRIVNTGKDLDPVLVSREITNYLIKRI